MAGKSNYDKLVNSISKRLDEMNHEKCKTVEEAERNEATLVSTGLAMSYGPGSYDYCPIHPAVVRFRGQCHMCPDE